MLFTDSVFIGIDPNPRRKSFSYAALDRDLNLIALADSELDDLTAFLGAQNAALVAVNSPSHVNRGLVRKQLEKQSLTPILRQARGVEMRVAEYELFEHGIVVTGTPPRKELCPAWKQAGFKLYAYLSKMGFKPFPAQDASCQWLETHPHACFCVLLEQSPLPKLTLEGRLQRQLILYERGLRIKDPMEFFEEITRYKMLKGILPNEMIYPAKVLDTLAAAYTAWLAGNKPETLSMLGEQSEGQIALPGKLKEKY